MRIPVLIMSILLIASSLYAATPHYAGTTAFDFLKFVPSARATGIGSSYAALTDDPHSLFWNPAALAGISRPVIAVDYMSLFEEMKMITLGSSIPLHRTGTIGFGLLYLKSGSIPITTTSPIPVDTTSLSGFVFTGGYGITGKNLRNSAALNLPHALDTLHLGALIKFFGENMYNNSRSGIAIDIGFSYSINNNTTLAFTVQNLGSSSKLIDYKDSVPTLINFGGRYDMPFTKNNPDTGISLFAGMNKKLGEPFQAQTGFETFINQMFFIRFGYTLQHSTTRFTAGIGVLYENINFDYAYQPYSDLGRNHIISAGYRIQLSKKQKLYNTIESFRDDIHENNDDNEASSSTDESEDTDKKQLIQEIKELGDEIDNSR